MDKSTLVKNSSELLEALDKTSVKPKAAVLIHNDETDTWRLWIVPSDDAHDKRDFYRQASEIISNQRDKDEDFDIGIVDLIPSKNQSIQMLSRFFHGHGRVNMYGNIYNGVYVPDGVILRMLV